MKIETRFISSARALAALALGTATLFAAGQAAAQADTPVVAPLVLTAKQPLPKTLDRLVIIDREVGDAAAKPIEPLNAVLVHYTGWLYDPSKPDGKGAEFDSSRGRPTAFGFMVGVGRVIKGWDQGVVGMRVKGKRTLIIPAALAYGDKERPKIPANSNLIFDIEMIDIVGAAPAAAPTALKATDPLPLTIVQIGYIDTVAGTGAEAKAGNTVTVNYTGWLYDPSQKEGKGNKFDSSVDAGKPFSFPLGAGRVIQGWDKGVVGMKVGGKRTLIIPAQFGYGARGAGGVIPPNANLIFDVELLDAGGK